jgi:hypothetical protein
MMMIDGALGFDGVALRLGIGNKSMGCNRYCCVYWR